MVPKKNNSDNRKNKAKNFGGSLKVSATTSASTVIKKSNEILKQEPKQQKKQNPQQQSDDRRGVCPTSPRRVSIESNDDVVVEPIALVGLNDNANEEDTAPHNNDEIIPLVRREANHRHHQHCHRNNHHVRHNDHDILITDALNVRRQEDLQKQQREQFYRYLGIQDP